jgi:amino acid transporter
VWSTTAVVIGIVIGSGIFKKPQLVAANVPGFSLAATVWIVGGISALLGAIAYAEVAVLFPLAGGNYIFLREAFGLRCGFLWGWVEFWVIRSGSLAALATIFTESLNSVIFGLCGKSLGFWPQAGVTSAVIMALGLVNARGVRWGAGLQFAVTTVKVGSLVAIFILPFVAFALLSNAAKPQASNLLPLFPPGGKFTVGGFTTALLGVLWAYHGWMGMQPLAGEVRDPQTTLPRALLAGTGAVIALYLAANLAYYLIIPPPEIAGIKSTNVATVFAQRLLGPGGAILAAAAVIFSTFGALNGNLLAGPRLLYAMGEDRLAPAVMTAIHPTYRTPAVAILAMAGFSVVLVLGAAGLTQFEVLDKSKPNFDRLTDLAMFGSLTFETLAVAAIFVFRKTLRDVERPYRCPGYPLVPLAHILIMVAVLVNMFVNQRTEALVGIAFIVVGAGVYPLIRPKDALVATG